MSSHWDVHVYSLYSLSTIANHTYRDTPYSYISYRSSFPLTNVSSFHVCPSPLLKTNVCSIIKCEFSWLCLVIKCTTCTVEGSFRGFQSQRIHWSSFWSNLMHVAPPKCDFLVIFHHFSTLDCSVRPKLMVITIYHFAKIVVINQPSIWHKPKPSLPYMMLPKQQAVLNNRIIIVISLTVSFYSSKN